MTPVLAHATSGAVPETKRKLLDAAMQLMLRQGFTATTVDQICDEADLTKGSFFHYFESKEEIGEAVLDHFCAAQGQAFGAAPFHALTDPLDRFHGLIDFFTGMLRQKKPQSCLIGNMTQELAATHPKIRAKCQAKFGKILEFVEA